MKKFIYLVAPLMCFSTLVGCKTGGGGDDPDIKYFDVTFMLEDGQYGSKVKVESGKTVSIPAEPHKDNDGHYSYSFDKWYTDNTYKNAYNFSNPVTNDLVIYGKFNKTGLPHYVDFVLEGDPYEETVTVYEGKKLTPPALPTKKPNSEYEYTFDKWYINADYKDEYNFDNPVTCNLTLYGKFLKTERSSYVVTFMNGGEVFDTQNVAKGGHASVPTEIPTKESDECAYSFKEWQCDGETFNFETTTINDDITLIAKFDEVTSFTVIWNDSDGNTLEIDEGVPFGSIPEYNGETPTKATEDGFYSYEFVGWDNEIKEVTSDIVYTANFSETEKVLNPDVSVIGINLTEAGEFKINGSPISGQEIVIDWGDGSPHETKTSSGNYSHQYETAGQKNILIKNASGLYKDNSFINLIVSINLGYGVSVVDINAFKDSQSLKTVVIPQTVKTVGASAFSNCKSLESVEFNEGLETIGSYAFSSCNLENVTLPDSVLEAGNNAFQNCYSLKSFDTGNGIKRLPGNFLKGCTNLISLKIGSGVESFDKNALYNCNGSLTKIVVDEKNINFDSREDCNAIISTVNVRYNDDSAALDTLLYGCKTTIIPNGVIGIYDNAFYSAGLTTLDIPDSVLTIGTSAFGYNYHFASFTAGKGLKSLGASAFAGCMDLRTVDLSLTEDFVSGGSDMFSGCHPYLSIYVKTEELDKYKEANFWSNYQDHIFAKNI